MEFHKIDRKNWSRQEHYEYYTKQVRNSYQMNVNINVTKLRKQCRKRKFRFYPAMIYAVMKAINDNEAFRMAVNEDGELGYYDVCHPSYTVFHEDDQTFSDIWTFYNKDFQTFYNAVIYDMKVCQNIRGIKAKPDRPDAFTPLSCVPWIHYTGISHDTPCSGEMYFPVITFGKYKKQDGKWMLPFSVFINHAVADGYHTAKLLNDIQFNCKKCKEWMR